MAWMADEYAAIVGEVTPAVITGKPIALGGSLGREDATARGGYYLLLHRAQKLGLRPGARAAIQGFGNAGKHIAQLLRAWLKRVCFSFELPFHQNWSKVGDRMVASRRGLVRYFGARRPCSIFLEVSALRFNHEDCIRGITETRRSENAP